MFEVGQKVTCNGNSQGRVQSVNRRNIDGVHITEYEVSLMDGTRFVGVVSVSERDLLIENKVAA